MKTAMRRKLARLPFEEKIRMVGELIRLSRNVRAQRVREPAENDLQSGSANPLPLKPDNPRDPVAAAVSAAMFVRF
jgi:pheromone shutdown protein TraB